MNKHNLRLTAGFLLLLFTILFLIQQFVDEGVRNSPYSHFNKVNLIAGHKIDPEIAIFGSSVSEVGIDPEIIKKQTGLNAYNFSIDGTHFIQLKGIMDEFGDYTEKCKVVILTEVFFTFEKTNQLAEVQRYLAHINNENIYQSLYSIQPDFTWKLRYIPFYRFIVIEHPYYKASLLGWERKLNRKKNTNSNYGFFPKDLTWDPELDSINNITKPLTISIDKNIVNEYKRTLDHFTKKGIKVMIVLSPIQKDGRELFENLNDLKNTLKNLAGENIYYFDFSSLPFTDNKEFFYNNSHVNRKGAEIFSSTLATSVNEILNKKGSFN